MSLVSSSEVKIIVALYLDIAFRKAIKVLLYSSSSTIVSLIIVMGSITILEYFSVLSSSLIVLVSFSKLVANSS